MQLSAREISRVTQGVWSSGVREDLTFSAVSTDTRKLEPGDLFVALIGERFDAHDHLEEAVAKGAAGLVVSRDCAASGPVLRVEDTLRALGDMAAVWRGKCRARRVSVVGSSGKTTTKEMLAAILSRVASTLASAGNFNNLIGLPLTLFGLAEQHRWAVLELGMNVPGELERLTRIADPDLLLLVNVGTAHIGQFGGSQEALNEAKAEAVRALRPGVPVVINCDCANLKWILERYGAGHPVTTFSVERSGDVRATGIRPMESCGYAFELWFGDRRIEVRLPVFGRYNVGNAVAAGAAAYALGVEPEKIVEALEAFRSTAMRSEIRQVGGVTLVVDCYNANPDSMSAALLSLEDCPHAGGRTYLVLGEMLELGEKSGKMHRRIARQVGAMKGVDGVFVLGEQMGVVLEEWRRGTGRAIQYDGHELLAQDLIARVRRGDRVFFKGSRGNKLETVVQLLESHLMSNETQRSA